MPGPLTRAKRPNAIALNRETSQRIAQSRERALATMRALKALTEEPFLVPRRKRAADR